MRLFAGRTSADNAPRYWRSGQLAAGQVTKPTDLPCIEPSIEASPSQ